MPRVFVLVLAAILVACTALGVWADRWARARDTDVARAEAMSHAGKSEGAEREYWSMLEKGPITVPILVAFLEAHEHAVDAASSPPDDPDPPTAGTAGPPSRFRTSPPPVIEEGAIDALLARPDLPREVALLGRWWRGVVHGARSDDAQREVRAIADAEPPAPWANHLLAQDAVRHARLDDAADRFLREAIHFAERGYDADVAFSLWVDLDEWDRIDAALADPRVAALASPELQLRAAIRARDWGRAARAFPRTLRPAFSRGTLLLAAIAALAWAAFCARLGHVGARPAFRLPVYFAAFVLGIASVAMTLALVAIEEGVLAMRETQDPLRDFLFFTFGVGLREEISKLAFFLPLLPILRRKGSRLDVLVCGALVGLGFAAEENLGYLHGGDLSTAMARFLTANFFHMSMTAILAAALDEMVAEKDGSFRFSTTLLTVALLHGVYDFCLSNRTYGDLSWFAMAVFFWLARHFLSAVSWARAKERAADPRVMETFAIGMAVVVGSSFVYASALVGPKEAAAALAEGLLGLGIVILLFVQELRRTL